jgi:hypothetical protein
VISQKQVYLDKAAECALLAQAAEEPRIRAALVDITVRWTKLAELVELIQREECQGPHST